MRPVKCACTRTCTSENTYTCMRTYIGPRSARQAAQAQPGSGLPKLKPLASGTHWGGCTLWIRGFGPIRIENTYSYIYVCMNLHLYLHLYAYIYTYIYIYMCYPPPPKIYQNQCHQRYSWLLSSPQFRS